MPRKSKNVAEVGPFKVRVVALPKLPENCYGRYRERGSERIIEVAHENINAFDCTDTLIHELLHAVERSYGIKINEQSIRTLATGLTQALVSLGAIDPVKIRKLLLGISEESS